MVSKSGIVVEKSAQNNSCRHHWLIDMPSGPTSRGVCKFCGEERVFENFLQDLWRSDDIPGLGETSDILDTEQDIF